MDHPELARMMRLQSAVLPGSPLRVVTGTNKLLSEVPGAFGLKTGDTPQAGLVLYVRPLSVHVSTVTNLTFWVPVEPLVVARSWSFALTIVSPASPDKSNFR